MGLVLQVWPRSDFSLKIEICSGLPDFAVWVPTDELSSDYNSGSGFAAAPAVGCSTSEYCLNTCCALIELSFRLFFIYFQIHTITLCVTIWKD